MKKLQLLAASLIFSLVFTLDAFTQNVITEEGKATIVFYRKKKFSGSAITFNVQDSERNYGPLTNGGQITVSVDPGQHTFFSQVLSGDAVTLTVEAGQVYYVKGTVKVGVYAGRPRLEQVSEKTAKKDMK